MSFLTEIEKKHPKINIEAQKTLTSQSNLEQKEQCWRNHNTSFQIILQQHSNKTHMALAQKQIHKPME
jgi:hypothetical protein